MSTYDRSHETLLNAVASAVFIARDDGRILFANSAGLALLGLPNERVADQPLIAFIHADFQTQFQTVFSGSSPCEIRLSPGHEREQWVECSAAAYTFANSPCWLITVVDITERRQKTRESESRRELLHRMIDSIPDEIYMKDENCRFIVANRATWITNNYQSEAEILGLNDIDLFGENGLPLIENDRRLINDHQSIINYEVLTSDAWKRNRPSDWLLITKVPLYYDDGTPQGIIGINRNINDYKKAEAALDESQRLIRRISETIPDIIYIFDPITLTNVYTNRQIDQILGYTPEEVREMGANLLAQVIHPDDLRLYSINFEQFAQARDGEVIETQVRVRHANGEWRWFHFRETILSRNDAGAPHHVLGIAQDITTRKQAEESLVQMAAQQEQQARLLDEILSATPDYIVQIDREGRHQYVNQPALKLFDLKAEQVLGRTLSELKITPQEVSDSVENRIRTVFETGQSIVYEIPGATQPGVVREFQVTLSPIRDTHGQITSVVLAARDVTNHNEMQRALVEQERIRLALEKETELSDLKTRLMITIAHEFRTPLTVISTSGYLLERQLSHLPDARPHYNVRQIQNAIDHLTNMLDDIGLIIQGVFKRLIFVPAILNLDTLCRRVVDECQSHHEGRTIEYRLTGDHRALVADEQIIRRVLTTLLENAIQYSSAESVVRLDVTIENQAIVLRVRDEGIGIPAEDQPHLFDPLYRGSNIGQVSGLGLGLTIVKDAVDLHGGTITIESAPGQGTTFIISLPAG